MSGFPQGSFANNASTINQPHYRRIYLDIEQKIQSGALAFGDQLPLLPELCRQYGVSEAPVRRALDELARMGLIIRQRGRGKGTFITKRLLPPTILRVLLLGFDLSRSVIEAYHEIYGVLDGIRAGAAAHNCTVQTISEDALANLATIPQGTRIGYLVLSNLANKYSDGYEIAALNNAPCILVNSPQPIPNRLTTSADIEEGAFLGTDHLAQLGHQRIAYVGKTQGGWFIPRYRGYCRALVKNNLPLDESLVQETSGLSGGEDATALDYLLSLPDPPTAIFACSDYRALHILNHAQNRLGLLIPGDLSLCGYDDIGACETVSPPITSVYHPLREQGEAAVELLIQILDGKSVVGTEQRILPPRLHLRKSTAPYLPKPTL